MPEIITSEY